MLKMKFEGTGWIYVEETDAKIATTQLQYYIEIQLSNVEDELPTGTMS